MSKTDNFRRQHKELLKLAGDMSALLNTVGTNDGAESVRKLLSNLAGRVKVHLVMEDESLYPQLIAGGDSEISKKAKQYQEEMGEIKDVLPNISADGRATIFNTGKSQ